MTIEEYIRISNKDGEEYIYENLMSNLWRYN